MFYRPLGDEISDKVVFLQRVMHDLAVSIGMAERSGQTAAAAVLRQQLAARGRELTALVALQEGRERPSDFALGLANVGGDLSKALRTAAIVGGAALVAAIVLPSLLQGRRRG